jgi:hypothetical protein
MQVLQSLRIFLAEHSSGFALQRGKDQPITHANAAVNAPGGKFDVHFVQGFAPCEHVLIDAVDQSAVEIEQERGLTFGNCGAA